MGKLHGAEFVSLKATRKPEHPDKENDTIEWEGDMCEAAFERLRKFIARGTTPPGGKGK